MKKKNLLPRKIINCFVNIFSVFAILLAVSIMLWILYTVCKNGLKSITWGFLTNISKPYGVPNSGILNAIFGSILITFGASILATPLGLLAGVFLAEYKEHRKIINFLRFSANVMMGIPSVIIGLFIYILLVVPRGVFSGFAGSVALAIIMFPVIMRTTEDMLNMVPYTLRESALALGMTRTRTTFHIVFVSAKNGLLTGILLSLSRVSGETAPLLFTAMFSDAMPTNFFSGPTANLPILITEYATNSPFEAMHNMAWGAALVVTLGILIINITTKMIFRERKYGN